MQPQTYLLHFRMDKACELMGNPELTIADISRSVGYNDPLLFSNEPSDNIRQEMDDVRLLMPLQIECTMRGKRV
ncbi:hypothetical protein BVG16_26310 [Paenibacillus selenitireducens]|uniref:HTH araC/xylS-type domain-containing protein n=1 Tax=Paenibacillus selenitireducens TaxID=1324314 RepID=A0A1T2X293_9BACL|nr:hypothetical protein BVG16_26310 [Paenibacillus selenitireducens]